MNYIDQLASRVRQQLAPGTLVPVDQELLYRLYAALVLSKGEATTLRDVHDAWAIWRLYSDRPMHPDIRPFEELPPMVQALDARYAVAIREVARELRLSTTLQS